MAKYKTEVEAPPVPHMFFEVGDVVETPSGKVFRHYGQGKWAQENYVSFETSPGGLVRNSFGELVWRPGWNQLVKTVPTQVVHVSLNNGTGELNDGATAATTYTAALSTTLACPITGKPVYGFAGGEGVGENSVKWVNRVNITDAAPDEVWIIAVYSERSGGRARLRLGGTDCSFTDPTKYREFYWPGTHVRRGWNFLAVKNVEQYISPSTYGVVGTNDFSDWVNGPEFSDTSTIRSVQIVVENNPHQAYIAGLWRAPKGWATGAIMWGADDVLRTFADLAVPEFERRGIPYTLNLTTSWMSYMGTHVTHAMAQALSKSPRCQIWGHTNNHPNMPTLSADEAKLELLRSHTVLKSNGFFAAGMAWPFNASNDATEAQAREQGFKLARAAEGKFLNPWQPAHRAFCLPSITIEETNSWRADASINRLATLGLSGIAYMHGTIEGGEGIDTIPAPSKHYLAHLKRWLDLTEAKMESGELVALHIDEYFRACGTDPMTTPFIEKAP